MDVATLRASVDAAFREVEQEVSSLRATIKDREITIMQLEAESLSLKGQLQAVHQDITFEADFSVED